jgi:virginiamycin B lyase
MTRILRGLSLAFAAWAGLLSPGAFAAIAGTGIVTGSVTAPAPFVAAKVFLRHADKPITYMVYTQGGRYEAVNLFPGRYEVSVEKAGFAAARRSVAVAAEARATVDFALKVVDVVPKYVGARVLRGTATAPYDVIYPAGPGRALVERSCVVCHGVNFLPSLANDREGWEGVLALMTNPGAFGVEQGESMFAPDLFDAAERETLLDYLTANFGRGSPKRAVREVQLPELDEAELGKAMFMVYDFPNTEAMPDRYTQEPHFDSQGNVWMAQPRSPGSVIRLDPRTGEFRDFAPPDPEWAPHAIAVDKDDTVWYTGKGSRLAHLDPRTGKLDLYPVLRRGEHGIAVVLDSKGDAWFTALQGNQIGHWNRKTDQTRMLPNPTPRGRPYGMLVDRQDKVWYAQFHGCKVTRFDPVTQRFTEFPALSQPCTMRRFGLDSQDRIWYGLWSHSQDKRGRIGRLDTRTGRIVEFTVPLDHSNPYDVWPDGEDRVWITSDNHLIRFDPATEKFTFYPVVESRTDMPKLSVTREGALWYAPRGYSSSRGGPAAAAAFYPDKHRMTTFGAYYAENAVEHRIGRYRGPDRPVRGNAAEIMKKVGSFSAPTRRDGTSAHAD